MGSQVIPLKSPLVILRGSVTDVDSRILVEGLGHSVSAFVEVQMKLAGETVTLRQLSHEPMNISEGDEVIVAVKRKGSVFLISSWWNVTKGSGFEVSASIFWPSVVATITVILFQAYLVLLGKDIFRTHEIYVVWLILLMCVAFLGVGLRQRQERRLLQSAKFPYAKKH
ncbi:hypothetical protein [Oleiharenicola lentus]|uniref:hypothetical protein n=1 Tax=Oleiharenicola lentus TaxID=2508720 RepID=UPI003F680D30